MSSQPSIESIYTDGACSGNPGPGGWGVVVYYDDGSINEIGDGAAQTTNNRMEMQAAISALKYLNKSGQKQPITLYTDSEYLINCVTKWVKGWKKKGWKKADGQPVLNQDLLQVLDDLNVSQVSWKYVKGHAGNVGNERCDEIARSFSSGKPISLKKLEHLRKSEEKQVTNEVDITRESESLENSTIINTKTNDISSLALDKKLMESSNLNIPINTEEIPRSSKVGQLSQLIETLRIADEIAEKGYLITSSELADLMDVHASAVTSRGDQWRWRNWVVSRVRREGNQILWELERGDKVETEIEL
jgi:ribonuclease HI